MYQPSAVHIVLQYSQAVWVVKDTACFCAGLRSAGLPWENLILDIFHLLFCLISLTALNTCIKYFLDYELKSEIKPHPFLH